MTFFISYDNVANMNLWFRKSHCKEWTERIVCLQNDLFLEITWQFVRMRDLTNRDPILK